MLDVLSSTLPSLFIAIGIALAAAPAAAQSCNTAERTIELILDASGSMNARLPNGETRIAVAQRAIKGVAGFVPAQTQLSLRMYGAQSAASQKNCQDTHLAVPFGPAGASGDAITAMVDRAKAQGYTPIAYSLGQAANDFAAEARERVIVLVSDGKETCQGDPVVAAKALAAKGITVHTVGFVADSAARGQLQAIARATGGTYFDAPAGPELPDTLKSALSACKKKTVVVMPSKPQPGKLRTTSATWLTSHAVLDAESGQQVGAFNSSRLEIPLPAGIYEVRFGSASWKGIEVRPGETTTIAPGVLKVEAGVFVHAAVVDAETGDKHGSFDNVSTAVTLMPGVYDLRFAKSEWRYIKVDGGKTTTVRPVAVILAPDLKWKAAKVTTQEGKEVARFNAVSTKVALPPGDYIVEVDGSKFPFPATEGETFEVKAQ